MLAVSVPEFGSSEALRVIDVPKPSPGPSDLLVRVRAAGVNRADLMQRSGRYPAPPGGDSSRLGLEFAGVVEEVGDRVGTIAEGTRVMGLLTDGAQAQYVVAHEREVVRVPDALSDVEAGGAVEAFVTAHDALFTIGDLRPGRPVLIHAVGSGVATAAIQLASIAGATPIGTSRTAAKLARAAPLGLKRGVDVSSEDFAAVIEREYPGGVDVVIDFIGLPNFASNVRSLGPGGRLVLVGSMGGTKGDVDLAPLMGKRIRVEGTTMRGRPFEARCSAVAAFGREVVPLLASGRAKVIVDRTFPLEEVARAHELMESNDTFGKIVLTLG